MHSTQLTSPPHESSLRKVALLLAGLDTEAAHRLLSQMDTESARAARDAWARLGPVDAAEQSAVIAEFLGGMSEAAHKQDSADSSAAELDASLARKLASDETLTAVTDSASPDQRRPAPSFVERDDPWRPIQATSARVLARCLAGENSQLVAVVLAQLSVAHAAETLQYLPIESQRELLTRIARVTTPPDDLLRDIGQWLAERLSRSGELLGDRATPFRAQTPRSAAYSQRTMTNFASDANRTRDVHDANHANHGNHANHANHGRDASDGRGADETDDAGHAEHRRKLRTSSGAHVVTGGAETTAMADVGEPALPVREPLVSFAQLVDLDDDRLALVLRQAAPLEIVLAIAGAAPDVARRWLERLPEADRRHMQRTLTQLGPWRLSDATAAQERLVELANQPRGRHGVSRIGATGG